MAYKILLPFDGSGCSIKAAEYVAELMSAGRDMSCTVLFVVPFTRDLARFLGMTDNEYSAREEELLDGIKNGISAIFRSRGLQFEAPDRGRPCEGYL